MTAGTYTRWVRSHRVSMLKLRLRSAIVGWLGEHAVLYFPLARALSNPVRDGKAVLVNRRTDLVVEGFPGSGNTFAVAALALSQDAAFSMAHHLHVPSQIKRALHWNKPVLVVVRPPKASIASFLVRAPELHAQLPRVIDEYARYHEFLVRCGGRVLVADFDSVTHDFGGVVRRLNERYELRLRPFRHDEANAQRCFGWIERWYRKGAWIEQRIREGRAVPNEAEQAPGPSDARRRHKAALREAFDDPSLARKWRRAERAYERLVSAQVGEVTAA